MRNSSLTRALRAFIPLALACGLALGCSNPTDPTPRSGGPAGTSPTADTPSLRISVEPTYSGRTLLLRWYHLSYQDPGAASRTLADRPLAQALSIPSREAVLDLPASVDTLFEFYVNANEYARTEMAGKLDQGDLDLIAKLSGHRWAMAPLTLASSDEMAKVTLSRAAAWTPGDTVALHGSHVLLWVREPLEANDDVYLKAWGLVGRVGAGWHLLRYEGSKRMVPCPMSDTVFFRKSNPKPNLV